MASFVTPGLDAAIPSPDLSVPDEVRLPEELPSLGALAGAAFRSENTVGSFMSFAASRERGDTPFRPTPALIAGTVFEDRPDLLAGVDSMEGFVALKGHLEQQQADRDLLAASGRFGIAATLAASVLDPVNLIPVAGGAAKANALRKIGTVTASSVGGAAIAEGTLAATQDFRTPEEIAFGLGGAAVLGAGLGGFGAFLGRRARAAQMDAIRRMVDPESTSPQTRRARDLRRTLDEYEATRAREGDDAIEPEVHAGARAARAELDELQTRTGAITEDGEILIAKADIDEFDAGGAGTRRTAGRDSGAPSRVTDDALETAQVERIRALKDERVTDAVENAEAIRERYAVEGCG